MSRCALAEDVHVCFTEEAAVFLDLRRNKYLGIDAEHVPAVRRLVEGADANEEQTSALAQALITRGLFTRNERRQERGRAQSLPRAKAAITELDQAWDSVVPVRTHHVFNLLRSYVIAVALWRLFPLTFTVRRAAARKARLGEATHIDIEELRNLIDVFERVRPAFYAAHSRCLVDTITLVEFLSRYSICPDWVFGVRTRPFEAHTWAQYDGYVLNDHPARTNTYVPILVV
jgi:hypothetical protein